MVPLFLRTRVRPFPRAKGRRRLQFYRVFVFRDKATMHAFRNEQTRANPTIFRRLSRYQAIAQGWWMETNGRRDNCIGQVLFHAKFLGAGVTAHEMTHAALYAVAGRTKKGYELTEAQDEVLADVVGQMVGQFWRAWWRWEKQGKIK